MIARQQQQARPQHGLWAMKKHKFDMRKKKKHMATPPTKQAPFHQPSRVGRPGLLLAADHEGDYTGVHGYIM
jgi:hypothetical protein